MIPQRWVARSAMLLVLTASLQADTLYLRDGSRVQGELSRSATAPSNSRNGAATAAAARCGSIAMRWCASSSRPSANRTAPATTSLAGGRPSGMRERQTIVSADVAWNDSGIDVRAGQTIFFEAQGQVRWGKDRRDGPAGERNSPANPNRPMGNRNAAALIGKIGNGERLFLHRRRDGSGADAFRAAGSTSASTTMC